MTAATAARLAALRLEEAALLLADVRATVSLQSVHSAEEAAGLAAALANAAAMEVRAGQ